MPTEIIMPSIGPNIEAGMLARWCVKEGQRVRRGEVVAEIESDKATMEVESEHEGLIARLLVAEGARGVRVGDPIAVMTGDDEPASGPDLYHGAHQVNSQAAASCPDQNSASETKKGSGAAAAPVSRVDMRRIKASPIARRIARERRVDLTSLRGTGPGGRIIKSDVERVSSPITTELHVVQAERRPASEPASHAGKYETVPLSSMRRTIARRLTESKSTIPHFYLTVDVRLDALLGLRAEINEASDTKITVNDLLIKALGCALVRTPEANVQFAGDSLRQFERADVAVAVAVPGGLITPVVNDAAGKSIGAIARELRDLLQRARAGRLAPHEYQGGTASLSNLGMYGVRQFDAVINPPHALIVAVGAAEKRAVVHNDALQIATMMTATASFDHRAIDGATGAQLMATFREMLEQPVRLLMS